MPPRSAKGLRRDDVTAWSDCLHCRWERRKTNVRETQLHPTAARSKVPNMKRLKSRVKERSRADVRFQRPM
jgi:hypothetical protein